MRRLVINADDFGLTSGINRAIIEAHEHGVVTSATLMANGANFEEAVQLAKRAPELSVGCHVVLVDGNPVLAAERVPSLLRGGASAFHNSSGDFLRAVARGRVVAEEIEAEATAQIRKLQQAGIVVSHLDTHKHTHVFPKVLIPLLRAAKACGVSAIRAPFEPARAGQLAMRPALWKRWLAAWSFHHYASDFRRAVRTAGMTAPDGCLGIVATGVLNEQLFAWIAAHMPEGTWELVCHPGYVNEQLRGIRTRLRESRTVELQLLTSTGARELLGKYAIELTSYKAFAGQSVDSDAGGDGKRPVDRLPST